MMNKNLCYFVFWWGFIPPFFIFLTVILSAKHKKSSRIQTHRRSFVLRTQDGLLSLAQRKPLHSGLRISACAIKIAPLPALRFGRNGGFVRFQQVQCSNALSLFSHTAYACSCAIKDCFIPFANASVITSLSFGSNSLFITTRFRTSAYALYIN